MRSRKVRKILKKIYKKIADLVKKLEALIRENERTDEEINNPHRFL